MKNIIGVFLVLVVLIGCKKDNHTGFSSYISFSNRTSSNVEVQLYPKSSFLHGTNLYQSGTNGNGYQTTNIKLTKSDSTWGAQKDLYFTSDTSIKPAVLIGDVFDSIRILIKNTDSIVLHFSKVSSIHYSKNPYQDESIWSRHKLLRSMIDPSWNGFNYYYIFTIDTAFIQK